MRVLIVASSFLLAVASAFTTQQPHVVAPRTGVADEAIAHRNRRATVVADGKANGTFAFCLANDCTQAGASAVQSGASKMIPLLK